jgi:apoptosis-inducing factor 3
MAEHKVGAANTLLRNGEMKRLDLEGTPVVMARVEGQYYAFGGTCTHYGAPLHEGVLKGHTLMCPWHHACFDIRGGLRLEPPALNDLPHFPVRVEGDQVIVTLPQDNETEPQGKAEPGDKGTFVIVGGGSAGNAAAEELRRLGYVGEIVIVSAVPNVPVDRPNLSKDYLAGHAEPGWIPLRGDEGWYKARDIELRLNTTVTKIDPKAHMVHLDKGGTLRYDKLLLATGGIPRQLTDTPGTDLKGVFTLRVLADSDRIIEAAEKGKRAVVVGASFIGMEVAASLQGGRGVSVTVVGPEATPFERILGADIGKMFQQEHEANGVTFRLSSEVRRFVGHDGHMIGVELKSGDVLEADLVVVGIGVRPATDFLRASSLRLDEKDHSVRVSATLQTSDPDIFAAGDIARWDDGSERGLRIEHWRVAEQHGMVAARNMLGRADSADDHVPFFWTTQFGIELRYVGHAEKWDEIIYRYGKPEQKDFVALYVAGGKLLAGVGLKHDPEMDAIEFILRDRMALTPAQMRDESFDLIEYARNGRVAMGKS